jgi:hypothetical protein
MFADGEEHRGRMDALIVERRQELCADEADECAIAKCKIRLKWSLHGVTIASLKESGEDSRTNRLTGRRRQCNDEENGGPFLRVRVGKGFLFALRKEDDAMPVTPRRCQRCKAEIPLERLEVMPETRLCVRCSQEVGGEFERTIIPENLAKSGSLKKNYGGFTVKKTRRPLPPMEG